MIVQGKFCLMSKTASLSPTHWKAIELISGGKMSLKEVAQAVGLQPDTLYKLYEGHESRGVTGQLFKAELNKITKKNISRVKDLIADNKFLSHMMLNDYLRRKFSLDYVSDGDVETIISVVNALNKAPTVEINSTSFSYTKGLSAEDLMHEFNRLKSLAQGALNIRGVQGPGSGRSRRISLPVGSGSGSQEEPEDPDLRADAQTESFS